MQKLIASEDIFSKKRCTEYVIMASRFAYLINQKIKIKKNLF